MKTNDYKIEALKYVLPYLRTNEDVVALLKAIGATFNNLQDAVNYLLNSLQIHSARGVWLDYIGTEVGAQRDEMDFGNYFCVNRLHINEEKYFYFMSSGLNPQSPLSLTDAEFIQKILAYIGANKSCGTINECNDIIQTITNATKVIITQEDAYVFNIKLEGKGLILTKNTITYIQNVLGAGTYIKEIKVNDKTY